LLISWVDVGGSYIVQGVMYGLSTVWTVQMNDPGASARRDAAADRGAGHRSFMGSTLDGARYIWGNRPIRTVMGIVIILSLLDQRAMPLHLRYPCEPHASDAHTFGLARPRHGYLLPEPRTGAAREPGRRRAGGSVRGALDRRAHGRHLRWPRAVVAAGRAGG